MDSLMTLYQDHLSTLQMRFQQLLARNNLDAILIHSGERFSSFLDDYHYPFKVNPHFKAWLPVTSVPNCWLWIDGVNKPKLWFWQPEDYWYGAEPLTKSFWTDEIDIILLTKPDDIASLLPAQRHHVAYIGPVPARAAQTGIQPAQINPQASIDFLHFYRAFKTDYELYCLRAAQKTAIAGHRAAKEAFMAGLSEFDINIAYLSATGHTDSDVPYDNIAALNEHAAVLHYTKRDALPPAHLRSFLLDAGAEYNGYAADLTRTYAAQTNSEFSALICDMDVEQQRLIATLKVGMRYSDYHLQFHQRLASLLLKHHLIKGLSAEAVIASGITIPFMPHGLGHLLGLQVHDVAGFMQDDEGTHLAPPDQHPYLRCTRVLQPRMVLTVEPGLYFITSLLKSWQTGKYAHYFDWARIAALSPYGGIRIEDNIVIHEQGVENMTRDLKLD